MAILQIARNWARQPSYGALVNRLHPLSFGMAGCWLLNEEAGQTAFEAAGRPDRKGAFQSATTLPKWAGGQGFFNSGVQFQSSVTDQAINCGTSTDFDCDSSGRVVTMEAWFYYNSTSAAAEKTLFAKAYNTSNSSPAMALAVIDNSPTNIRIRPVLLGLNQNNSAELFTNNALTHFLCVFTNSGSTGSASTYVNGVFHNTISGTISGAMSGSALTIGGQQRTGSVVQESPDATIYKATIWNRALTAAEIVQLYRDPFCHIQTPRRFVFTSASGTTYSFSFTESVALGDSLSAAVTFNDSITESITAGDSLSASVTFNASFSESIAAGDSLAAALTVHASFAESIAAGDSISGSLTVNASFAESIVAGDSVSAMATFTDVITESIAAGDSLAGSLTVHATFTESVVLGDSLTATFSSTTTLVDRFKPELIAYLESLFGAQGVSVRSSRMFQDDVYPAFVLDVHRQPEALLSGASQTRTAEVDVKILDSDESLVDLLTTQVIDAFNNRVNFTMGTVPVMDSQVDLDIDDYDSPDDGSDDGVYEDTVSLVFHYRVNPS